MARKSGRKNFTIEWFGDEIAAAVREFEDDGLYAAGDVLLGDARRRAPSRSGEMRRSGFVATTKRSTYRRQKRDRSGRQMEKLKPRAGSALVAFASWYSNLLEDTGARRHEIPYKAKTARARARKTLLIPGIGYRKRVNHPGGRRRPFLGPALDAMRERCGEALANEIRRRMEAKLP